MKESMFERQDRTIVSVKSIGKLELFDKPKQCCDCRLWCGRCCLNKLNKIAWSKACEIFESKDSAMYVIPLMEVAVQ